VLQYLNRLSDWLFVFSRYMSHTTGAAEKIWNP
jgi:cob(I)alamin adenosyltransferase